MSTTDSKEVIALFVADLHFSHKPPLVRIREENWYKAMERPLGQLRDLQIKYQCPIIIAGDVFDAGWQAHKCPPELINWVLEMLPENCYAVPGQHDLPHHRYEDVFKSAYGTLVAARKLISLDAEESPVEIITTGDRVLRLHGFPWGSIVRPPQDCNGLCIEIAVIHQYLWIKGCSYPDAHPDQHVKNVKDRLLRYHVSVSGDNHQHFHRKDVNLWNCGAFMRRRLDEVNHRPSIGLLHSDLSVSRHYLDVSQDVFDDTPREGKKTSNIDPSELVDELKNLGDKVLDFTEALERLQASGQIEDDVWQIILSALENKT